MASYNPPNEYITVFNTNLFNQPEDTLSIVEGNQLYLSKRESDTSTAPLTTFNGQVSFNNEAPISNTTPSLSTHLATLGYLASFYQTISGMSAYLTTSAAASTYQTIANMTNYVSRTGNVIENITGLKTFTNNIEIFDSSTALDEPSLILRTISGASGSSVIKYSGSILSINNTNSSGDILFQTSGNNRLGITSATTTIYNALTCSSQATFNTLCPISSVSPSQDNHLTRRDFVLGQGFTTLTLVQSNANTFSSTTTFSVIPICSINANANNQLVNWQTLNGQGFTTLSLVQSNNNTFTGTNQFNQPIKIQYAAAQYTDLEQSAQIFSILNKATGGSVRIQCRTSPGLSDTTIATFNTTGITLGLSSASNSISGPTTFNQDVTLSGTLTAGTTLLNNTISGPTTFNQAVSATGLLTATGGLKTNAITPLVGSGQNDIYSSLPTGGTIVFGTASRTMNIYGNVNMVNSCQFSGFLLTNDISFASGQGGTAKTIYTSLTTGGSVTIGSNTANTTTNIRGGAISIGGTSNNLTIESPTKFNTKINFYSGTTNYTEVLQTGAQLTIKPVHDNGTIALFSTNTSGTQTQQLLINNSGVSASSISSTNIFSTNYNTSSQVIDFASNITTGTISLATNLTTGNLNIGNATTGSFKINIRGSLFSTGQATFQNFCPKSETDPAVANDLVKLSYLQNNFCDRSTTQIIGGEKTFTGNTIIGSALYFTDLDNTSSLNKPVIYQYGGVLFFTTNNNYSNGYEFMCNHNTTIIINQTDTEINNTVNIKGSLKYRYDKLVDEIQTLTTTNEVLHFPLQQTTIFTNTSNISVTLPQINSDTQIGLRFTFLNLGSVSTITTFNAHSPNQIIIIGQVTQVSSTTGLINNANNSCSLVIVKLSGVYCWAEYI